MGELSGPSCSHKACAEHSEDKIRSDGACDMNCMMPNCELLLDDEKVLFYITDSSLVSLYHRLTVNSYVSSNRRIKWCPGIDCGRTVKLSDTSRRLLFIPLRLLSHEPLTCEMMNKWNSKTQESSKTLVWTARFTKPCHLDCHASDQLKTAVDALFASRRTLMNSYIFAFFLEKDNNARIFENNQADLHGAVEKLPKTLHEKIKKQRLENLEKLLTEIHVKCVYEEHRRKILLDHCKEGYDYNFWKFEGQPF